MLILGWILLLFNTALAVWNLLLTKNFVLIPINVIGMGFAILIISNAMRKRKIEAFTKKREED